MNIHPLQAMVDAMNAKAQVERTKVQLTLGDFIRQLEALPSYMPVRRLYNPHSYRGYYCDLALESDEGVTVPVSELLATLKGCLGKVFGGYKGGDFPMHENTPVWVAGYGCCGDQIVGVHDDGVISQAEEI